MVIKKVIFVTLLCVVGVIAYYYLNPVQFRLMPKCPFKLITGLNCPGCGIQRAIHALLHGEIKEALHYNYYLLYSGPYAASFLFVWLAPNYKFSTKLKRIIENKYVVNIYVVTFLLWLLIRNIYNI